MAFQLDALFYTLEARTTGFARDLELAKSVFTNSTDFIAKNGALFAASLGAAFISIAAKATWMAGEYDAALRRIQSASPILVGEMEQVDEAITRLGRRTAQSREALIGGALEIAQTGVDSAEELVVRLQRAADLADASFTDLGRTIQGIDLIADAFQMSTVAAADALDQIWMATRGKVQLDLVLDTLERGATTLHSFNADAVETGEAIGTLLDAGATKRQAGMALISILDKAADAARKTSAQTREEADAIDILRRAVNPATIEAKGLVGALVGLSEAAKGNVTTLMAAGLSAAEATVVTRLQAAAIKDTRTESVKLAAAHATVAETARLNRESTTALATQLKNELSVQMVALGNVFLPKLISVMLNIVNMFDRAGASVRNFEHALSVLGRTDFKPAEQGKFKGIWDFLLGGRMRIDLGRGGAGRTGWISGAFVEQERALAALEQQYTKFGREGFKGITPEEAATIVANINQVIAATGKQADAYDNLKAGILSAARATVEAAEQSAAAERTAAAATTDAIAKSIEEMFKKIKVLGETSDAAQKAEAEIQKIQALQDRVQAFAGGAVEAGPYERARQAAFDLTQQIIELAATSKEGAVDVVGLVGKVEEGLRNQALTIRRTLEADVQALTASMTTTLVDDMILAAEQLAVAWQQKIADLQKTDPAAAEALREQVEAYQEQQAAMLLVVKAQEAMEKAFAKIARTAQDTSYADQAKEAQAAFDANAKTLLDKLVPGTKAYADAEKLIAEYAARIKELTQQTYDPNLGNAKIFMDSQNSTAGTVDNLQQMVEKVHDVASGALGLAEALGIGNANTIALLRNLVEIGQNIPDLTKLNTKTGLKDIQWGNVASMVGSVAGLVAGALGKSPAEREREQQHRENMEVLRQIEKHTGDLVGTGLTGTMQAQLTTGLGGFLDRVVRPREERMAAGFPRLTIKYDKAAIERATGMSWQELFDTAASMGIALNRTASSLEEFFARLTDSDFARWRETFAGQMSKLEQDLRVEGVTDALAILIRKMTVLMAETPAIKQAIEGLDLTSAEDRATAIQRLTDLYNSIPNLSAAERGGLTIEEFYDQTVDSIVAIRAAQEEAEAAARKKIFSAQTISAALRDIEDPAKLIVLQADAIAKAFPEIAEALGQFDFTTAAGIAAFGDAIPGLVEGLQSGAIVIEGLTEEELEELIQSLLGLEAAGDAAEAAITSLGMRLDRAGRDAALRDASEEPLAQFTRLGKTLGEVFPGIAEFLGQFDLTTVEGAKAFGEAVADLITGLEDGSIVIEGLSAEDIPTLVSALVDLETAGDAAEAAVKSLADTLSEAFNEIELDAAIFGEEITDTIGKKLTEFGLGEFDLTTQAGRDAARNALRDLARADPTLKTLIRDVLQSIEGLPEIPDAVAAAVAAATGGGGRGGTTTGSLQSLTLYQGDRLITLAETQLLRQTQIRDSLDEVLGFVTSPTAAQAWRTGGGVPGATYNTFQFYTTVPAGTTDPARFGSQVGRAQIDEFLADAVVRQRFFSGSGQVL